MAPCLTGKRAGREGDKDGGMLQGEGDFLPRPGLSESQRSAPEPGTPRLELVGAIGAAEIQRA